MASTDARPVPQKNVAYRATFPIYDADGDLVTGAAGLDSEISKDAGTFVDVTAEATEIATASGVYYLDMTATEMNADTVVVIVKTSTTGAKTTVLVFYPEEAGDIRVTSADDAAIKAKTDLIPGTMDGKTFAEVTLLMAAALLGKASGLGTTTAVFRALDDSQNRISATVDTDGNRSAVTLDATSP